MRRSGTTKEVSLRPLAIWDKKAESELEYSDKDWFLLRCVQQAGPPLQAAAVSGNCSTDLKDPQPTVGSLYFQPSPNRPKLPAGTEKTGMALKRMVLEIGMGTDIRGADPTKAAVRALRDALWHNSLNVANALGLDTDSMQVEVTVGVPHPERVNKEEVLATLPHGTGTVTVVDGGLEIPNDEGTNSTLIANAAAVVWLDVA